MADFLKERVEYSEWKIAPALLATLSSSCCCLRVRFKISFKQLNRF